jgi:hypothetical protein
METTCQAQHKTKQEVGEVSGVNAVGRNVTDDCDDRILGFALDSAPVQRYIRDY